VNWLAGAIYQAADDNQVGQSTDSSSFGAIVEARYLQTSPIPTNPPPNLETLWLDTNQVRLSWTGGGYRLETATNVATFGTNTVVGPWADAPNMANPYTVIVGEEPFRVYRLRK
jgi:hypothetical protein